MTEWRAPFVFHEPRDTSLTAEGPGFGSDSVMTKWRNAVLFPRTSVRIHIEYLSGEYRKPFYYNTALVRSEEVLPSASNPVFLTGERDAGFYRPSALWLVDLELIHCARACPAVSDPSGRQRFDPPLLPRGSHAPLQVLLTAVEESPSPGANEKRGWPRHLGYRM